MFRAGGFPGSWGPARVPPFGWRGYGPLPGAPVPARPWLWAGRRFPVQGVRVVLHGLPAGADRHNGQLGLVVDYDGFSGRCTVVLQGGPKEDEEEVTIAVRPENLTQVLPVEIFGVGSRPELNGQLGILVGYNDLKEQYAVSVCAVLPTPLLHKEGWG